MFNAQCYKYFNTKVDVSTAIDVTFQHTVLLEYVAQDMHTSLFITIILLEEETISIYSKELYLSYAFLCQSSAQHNKLKVDL